MMIDTWFGEPGAETLGFVHVPESGSARGGVVICPPLGYDHFNSYRAMRLLGQELADAGLVALRFAYRGEGDARGASSQPDAPEGWLASIAQAARFLRASGLDDIALVGLSSGALLASEALDRIPDAAALVLWDPALSGSRFVRRQRSLHDLAVGVPRVADPALVPLVSLTLHADAAAWLGARAITAETLADRVVPTLVLGRRADEGSSAFRRLRADEPAHVEVGVIDGQEDLLDVPSAIAVIPADTVLRIARWLSDRLRADPRPVRVDTRAEAVVGEAPDGRPIVERLGRFGEQRLFTIETLPAGADVAREDGDPGLVVMQPAAAEHRAGAGRFQVIAARELAARGYRAVRFDRRITGDSTDVDAHEQNLVLAEEWVSDADALVASMTAQSPVALFGVCSGAWVSGRIAERRASRLTVLAGPNYYKNIAFRPGQYARLARQNEQPGAPRLGGIKARVRDAMPAWLWRLVSRLQVFNDPAILLARPARSTQGTTAMLLTPDDERIYLNNRGPDALARLHARGADVRVTAYTFGDHAFLGDEVQRAAMVDLLDLVAETLPAGESAGALSHEALNEVAS